METLCLNLGDTDDGSDVVGGGGGDGGAECTPFESRLKEPCSEIPFKPPPLDAKKSLSLGSCLLPSPPSLLPSPPLPSLPAPLALPPQHTLSVAPQSTVSIVAFNWLDNASQSSTSSPRTVCSNFLNSAVDSTETVDVLVGSASLAPWSPNVVLSLFVTFLKLPKLLTLLTDFFRRVLVLPVPLRPNLMDGVRAIPLPPSTSS
mmetsp:Transcript_4965/g.10872  ORF Transcript_4965/g.10872 Transcript_4965/m.10872 type:complete len:203 (+) Transcript_4965:219-827(+)